MPNSKAFARRVSTWMRLSGFSIPLARSMSVGTLWSGTATVLPGARTLRPVILRPSKACGLVTSWTR